MVYSCGEDLSNLRDDSRSAVVFLVTRWKGFPHTPIQRSRVDYNLAPYSSNSQVLILIIVITNVLPVNGAAIQLIIIEYFPCEKAYIYKSKTFSRVYRLHA